MTHSIIHHCFPITISEHHRGGESFSTGPEPVHRLLPPLQGVLLDHRRQLHSGIAHPHCHHLTRQSHWKQLVARQNNLMFGASNSLLADANLADVSSLFQTHQFQSTSI